MSKRTFIFCDCCNPHGIRAINNRTKNIEKNGDERRSNNGRRSIDECNWYEGSKEESLEHGWVITLDNQTLCPKCYENSLSECLEKTG